MEANKERVEARGGRRCLSAFFSIAIGPQASCTLLSASSITATNTLCFFQIELKVSCMSSHFQSVVGEKPGIQHLYPKILTGFMVISCDSGQAGYLSPPQPLLLNITGFISATCTIPLLSFMPLLPT